MKKHISFLFLGLALASCQHEQEVETISTEEFLPKAQREYDYSEDTIQEVQKELSATQKVIKSNFNAVGFEINKTSSMNALIFMPDRLGHIKNEKLIFSADSVVYHYRHWQFKDSLQTMNAFYNWLDCFMEQCKSIRINENINGSYDAFAVWVSNSSIYYLSSDQKNINKSQWESILIPEEAIEWNYIMHQAKQGRIEWFMKKPENELQKNPES